MISSVLDTFLPIFWLPPNIFTTLRKCSYQQCTNYSWAG